VLALLRKSLPFLTAGIVAAVAYDGWLFYSRWRDAREAERERREMETDAARRTIEMLGGGQLKILHFLASPGVIRRGEHAAGRTPDRPALTPLDSSGGLT